MTTKVLTFHLAVEKGNININEKSNEKNTNSQFFSRFKKWRGFVNKLHKN